MCFHVASKMVNFIESFSTDVAVMCKVSRVQLHVAIQLTFCCVSFVTRSAAKVKSIVKVLQAAASRFCLIQNRRK